MEPILANSDSWVLATVRAQGIKTRRILLRNGLGDLTTVVLPCLYYFIPLFLYHTNDKSGLSLAAHRKQSYLGQIGYVLLTDLAHNLLADFYHKALSVSRFESYGLKRIVRDLLATPGRLIFDRDRLQRIELLSQKQFSEDLLMCLLKYCSGFQK